MGASPGLQNNQIPSAEQWNSFFSAKVDDLPVFYADAVLSGDVIVAPPGTGVVQIDSAGAVATLNVVAPSAAVQNQTFSVRSTVDISALTVGAGSGQSIIGGGATVLAANGGMGWQFRASNSTWYRAY